MRNEIWDQKTVEEITSSDDIDELLDMVWYIIHQWCEESTWAPQTVAEQLLSDINKTEVTS